MKMYLIVIILNLHGHSWLVATARGASAPQCRRGCWHPTLTMTNTPRRGLEGGLQACVGREGTAGKVSGLGEPWCWEEGSLVRRARRRGALWLEGVFLGKEILDGLFAHEDVGKETRSS